MAFEGLAYLVTPNDWLNSRLYLISVYVSHRRATIRSLLFRLAMRKTSLSLNRRESASLSGAAVLMFSTVPKTHGRMLTSAAIAFRSFRTMMGHSLGSVHCIGRSAGGLLFGFRIFCGSCFTHCE